MHINLRICGKSRKETFLGKKVSFRTILQKTFDLIFRHNVPRHKLRSNFGSRGRVPGGFCALEAILASGALAALSILCMQLVSQSLMLKKMLLCRQESILILTQYKSAFEASKRLPKNTNGCFSNGTPFALTVTPDTMLPFLQKAIFEMQWTIANKEFSETLNGLICKWN